jgi:hypothetical protein
MATLNQVYPILVDKGMADEHDIVNPAAATFPLVAGSIVNLNGLYGVVTQQALAGERTTLKFGNAMRKLECRFDGGGSVAAGDRVFLDRATGIVHHDTASGYKEVIALPRYETNDAREVNSATAAAATTDATITVVLRDVDIATDAEAMLVEFTGDDALN